MHALFGAPRDSQSKATPVAGSKDVMSLLSGKKKTPSDADYKPASSDSTKRCHECMNYGKPGAPESDCGVVIGIVKAEGVCDMFAQREYAQPGTVTIEIKHGV